MVHRHDRELQTVPEYRLSIVGGIGESYVRQSSPPFGVNYLSLFGLEAMECNVVLVVMFEECNGGGG